MIDGLIGITSLLIVILTIYEFFFNKVEKNIWWEQFYDGSRKLRIVFLGIALSVIYFLKSC